MSTVVASVRQSNFVLPRCSGANPRASRARVWSLNASEMDGPRKVGYSPDGTFRGQEASGPDWLVYGSGPRAEDQGLGEG